MAARGGSLSNVAVRAPGASWGVAAVHLSGSSRSQTPVPEAPTFVTVEVGRMTCAHRTRGRARVLLAPTRPHAQPTQVDGHRPRLRPPLWLPTRGTLCVVVCLWRWGLQVMPPRGNKAFIRLLEAAQADKRFRQMFRKHAGVTPAFKKHKWSHPGSYYVRRHGLGTGGWPSAPCPPSLHLRAGPLSHVRAGHERRRRVTCTACCPLLLPAAATHCPLLLPEAP
jgi:hypothetical protein